MPPADDSKRKAARETIDILNEISTLLNTGLDRQSLSYCVSLIENGVNPEALVGQNIVWILGVFHGSIKNYYRYYLLKRRPIERQPYRAAADSIRKALP
ncbi:hypothetical protein H2203_002973 [Taxawa tesnikishii (nom. ined.)]|nr:hypothetical protein H2203_002973 [Dothideales sp. JES 119]